MHLVEGDLGTWNRSCLGGKLPQIRSVEVGYRQAETAIQMAQDGYYFSLRLER